MTQKQAPRAGYVIVPFRTAKQYFTASSAYDRPRWVDLTEASVFLTPELAQSAVKKLWTGGAISAKVIPLSELARLDMEMPDEEMDGIEEPAGDEMVADRQGNEMGDEMRGTCSDCDCDPCECDGEQDGDIGLDGGDVLDDKLGDELGDKLDRKASFQDEEDSLLAQHLRAESGMEGEETARLHPKELAMLGKKRVDMKEAFKVPQRPGNDPAKPTENKTTVANMTDPKSKQVDFADPVGKEDKPTTDLTYATAHPHSDAVKVPTEIKSQLKAVVDQFAKEAKDKEFVDDNQGSFALTAAAALQQLLDDLETGTVEGIKQAQIHMTSFMNPITQHIPADVVTFIARGGRKPTLKDLFGVKWDNKRGDK